MTVNEAFIASCLSYPTTLDRSVTEPVVSDIPALIYLGQLDNQTPVTWGREVAKTLSRSHRGRVEQHGPRRDPPTTPSSARVTSPQRSWPIPSASRT